jgi:hypothetical protein
MARSNDPVTIAATDPSGGVEPDTRWIDEEPSVDGLQTAESTPLLRQNNLLTTAVAARAGVSVDTLQLRRI